MTFIDPTLDTPYAQLSFTQFEFLYKLYDSDRAVVGLHFPANN